MIYAKHTLDRWKPVRNGIYYCSPRCGFQCTRLAFEKATEEAQTLAARMGDGWEPNVWENWGWHYEVIKGIAKIAPNVSGDTVGGHWIIKSYWCSIGGIEYDERVTVNIPQFQATALSPESALGFATQDMRTMIEYINASLKEISE